MKIMACLKDQKQWLLFWEYKVSGGHLSRTDQQDFYEFIMEEKYLPIIRQMEEGWFPIPEFTVLNKQNSSKKRIVFTCPKEENYVLKFLAHLLLRYDSCMAPNLYSFRQNTGVKKAVTDLISGLQGTEWCAYKVDISDYFNSVDIELLLPLLKGILAEEPDIFSFLERMLRNPYVKKDNRLEAVKKGIMAGLPVSAFLANVYLMEMDWYFQKKEILYARYSDDIIVFAQNREELEGHIHKIHAFLEQYQLSVNPSKQCIYDIGEKWEYLGFSYDKGVIDISEVSLQKLKRKLKRKARALYRWKCRNKKEDIHAIRAYIKYFNRKFFDNPVHNEITWCRWYFPIINTTETLHVIDHYMQQCIRYLTTGRYTKANYNLRYETMQAMGYRSLVNEYYCQKRRNDIKNSSDDL